MTEAKTIQSLRSIFNKNIKSNVIVLGGDDEDSDDSMLETTPIKLVSGGALDRDDDDEPSYVPDIKAYNDSWLNVDNNVTHLGGDHITVVSGLKLDDDNDNANNNDTNNDDTIDEKLPQITIVNSSELVE
jgi:hypothetical protein